MKTKISPFFGSDLIVIPCVAMLIFAVAAMAYGIFKFTVSLFAPSGIGHLLGLAFAVGAVVLFACMLAWIFVPLYKKVLV